MPKIHKFGRNFGIIIEKNIINGFQLKKGDLFILEARPEAGEIVIKIHKKYLPHQKYLKNSMKGFRVKNAKKLRQQKILLKLSLQELENIEFSEWMPEEIETLKQLRKIQENPLLIKKINKMLRRYKKHLKIHKSRIKKLNNFNQQVSS